MLGKVWKRAQIMAAGRMVLAAAIVAVLGARLSAPASSAELLSSGKAVKVATRPIDTFRIGHTDRVFGQLIFLGGLELIASDRKVGGISGLVSLDGGKHLLAATDNGHWVAMTVIQDPDGTPRGIEQLRYAPMLGGDGKTLEKRWGHDTEALAVFGKTIFVSAETKNAIYRYPWPIASGRERMKDTVALSKAMKALPRNKGLEALAVAPAGSPLAGTLVAIAESSPSDAHDLSGFLVGAKGIEPFSIRRSDRFDATDAAFLPNGDLLLLERRFSLRDLIGLRLRRFSAAEIRPGAVVQGEVLLEADYSYQIDNMEAISVDRNAAGQTIVTLFSDNNRSLLQRALLLRFALAGSHD